MQKVEEFKDDVTGYYYKGYKDENISNKLFVQQLKENDIPFDMVWVTEDVERDMKNVSGTYTLDDVVEKYDYLVNSASNQGDLYFSFFGNEQGQQYQIFVYPREENIIYLQSKNPGIELTDVLQKKSELEKGRSR